MKPLEDVRIIAVEQYGAGPFGSVHLADLGAQVIKIEDPRVGGDGARPDTMKRITAMRVKCELAPFVVRGRSSDGNMLRTGEYR